MLDGERLAPVIELTIQHHYVQNDWTVFWPGQFVSESAPEPAVLEALRDLVRRGRLRDEVVLHCGDGTPTFRGSPAAAHEWLQRNQCQSCDPDPDVEHGVELRFVMTPEWQRALDELRDTAQKKTLTAPNPF